MKVRFAAAAALCLLAGAASAALNAYRTSISISEDVKLGDGSVLKAGKYDVEIDYKGFGNAAELRFFQKRVPVGHTPAEARGFPSQGPAGAIAPIDKKIQKGNEAAASDIFAKIGDIKGESLDDKHKETIEVKKPNPGGPVEFDWNRAGFPPGAQARPGKAAPSGRGFLKLSFDSSNSAAGFSALLPAAPKGK